MEQKFYNFDEAIEKLGISADKLNGLRESGMLRAYRDGSSWKFRGDEIEDMAQSGVPDLPPPSDIGLVNPEELVEAEPLDDLDEADDLELALADEGEDSSSEGEPDQSAMELRQQDTDSLSTGSELELAEQEDTVTAETSDVDLEPPDQSSDASDSILLSEEELGESVSGSLSTIIGRKELESADADLELELADEVTDDEDTKLSVSSEASDVLSSKIAGSGVLDDDEDLSSAKRKFEELEELEIDLAAESSLALDASDLAEAEQKSEKKLVSKEGDSDLKLDEEEAEDDANMGSTDVPLEELSGVSVPTDEGSGSELDLAGDDDLILADSGGSDLTLDSGDSGINLLPSDSGLELDDMPLDVGGSAILSSLSLEGSDPEISLLGGESSISSLTGDSGAELQTDDDFQLTPLTEGGIDDGDSSSQVIALDADLGGFEDEGNVAMVEADAFTADEEEGVELVEDFTGASAGGIGMGYAGTAVMPATESQYTIGNILLLSAPAILLMLAGIMMIDMVWNIWSWDETYSLNSSMLEALLGLFGLN